VLHLSSGGEALVSGIRSRLASLTEKPRVLARPSVACLEWIEPVFAMGNWGPELVDLAGGTNVLSTAGLHSAGIPWDPVREADPDVLAVASLCALVTLMSCRQGVVLSVTLPRAGVASRVAA
jgi:iron complex transport system substrate-binding protein